MGKSIWAQRGAGKDFFETPCLVLLGRPVGGPLGNGDQSQAVNDITQ